MTVNEAEFTQRLLKASQKDLAQKFKLTNRNKHDALSLNGLKISEFTGPIYTCEYLIKGTTESRLSGSCMD